MDPLQELKVLAGIGNRPNWQAYTVPESPDGSNISYTGTEKRQLEKKHKIEPGTPAWFKLWFSLPKLTGEKPI